MALRDLYRAEKKIARFPGWSKPNETGYIHFDAPLEIDGVVEHGLFLHGGCYQTMPDRHVSFSVVITRDGPRKRVELARADWKPITGGHSNKRKACTYRGRIPGSHIHHFEDNFVESSSKMMTGLPCAAPMDPEPQTYQELALLAQNLFKISNIDIVSVPEWTYSLF